jgi:ribonuclease R
LLEFHYWNNRKRFVVSLIFHGFPMADLSTRILATLTKVGYTPIKAKALARKLGIDSAHYADFRKVLRELVQHGKAHVGRNHTIRPTASAGNLVGIYRRTATGYHFVRPHPVEGKPQPDIAIRDEHVRDAAPGDEVLVKLQRNKERGSGHTGVIVQILNRATQQFVGRYFEREGVGYVRVTGHLFQRSVCVGDPGAKGAKPDDEVVLELLRYPRPGERGEGVITEVLGPRGAPGVDTLAVIRSYELPDEFPPDVLDEARHQAQIFDENDFDGREDFTRTLVITIDPINARDFDDAVNLVVDAATGHVQLTVHVADVAHFAPPGSALDREARKRGTSVYLPGRVLPMFPEVISNGLASLQADRLRYVKTAVMSFSAEGVPTAARFANGAIRVRQRFAYEQVSALLADPTAVPNVAPEVQAMLVAMRDFALVLRARRFKRGALEMTMPQTELDFDANGQVNGAHLASHDISHQIIEEFMLAANEAVATKLDDLDVPFLRRVHPAPDPKKLDAFATFAAHVGYPLKRGTDRFSLQKVLSASANQPERHAVHFALLRSLKQATYSPNDEEHFALASANYCHFTSPIRRYPDLTIHRQLGQWLRTGKAGGDLQELKILGDHCSRTERRAEQAERELVKTKLLTFMQTQINTEFDALITSVADYGFFCVAQGVPVEGLVHVRSLIDDFYFFDEDTLTLMGKRNKKKYRLGDRVRVRVERVDMDRRQLDFSLQRLTRVREAKSD